MEMEITMKAYLFDDKNPIFILRFLAQFKRTCDSNVVSKGMAVWIISTVMKVEPAFGLTFRMTPRGDKDSALPMPKACGEQILTYVEAANYLLKPYATYENIAEDTSEVSNLRKAPAETSVQFADVLFRALTLYAAGMCTTKKRRKGSILMDSFSIFKTQLGYSGVPNKKLIYWS